MIYEQEQDEREIKHISEMTSFQKEVCTMLKSMGFKYHYNKVYYLTPSSVPVDVSNINDLKDLYNIAYKNGLARKSVGNKKSFRSNQLIKSQ